jgi:DNA-binding NtrC family response regulator
MIQERFPEFPVLVVDDEENFLNSMDFYLRSNGITHVDRCRDSREVMPLLVKKKFSLILLDILMPHISGSELLTQIIVQHPEIPVIVIAGINDAARAVECKKLGAFNYLTKPIDTKELIRSIRDALDR